MANRRGDIGCWKETMTSQVWDQIALYEKVAQNEGSAEREYPLFKHWCVTIQP